MPETTIERRKSARDRKQVVPFSTSQPSKGTKSKFGTGKAAKSKAPAKAKPTEKAKKASKRGRSRQQSEESKNQSEEDEEGEDEDEGDNNNEDEQPDEEQQSDQEEESAEEASNNEESESESESPSEDSDQVSDVDFKKPRTPVARRGRGRATRGRGRGRSVALPRARARIGNADDAQINNDNTLFNAIKNPDTALQLTVSEWVEQYQDKESQQEAIADLVNMILRTAGCNTVVDIHQASDEDGVVDLLGDIQDTMKETALVNYPIISRSKEYRTFRNALANFLTRLITQTADSQSLYEPPFMSILNGWLSSLSSSKIRAFRHTCTLMSLLVAEGLCDVGKVVDREYTSANRAKEAEVKKARKDKSRLAELNKNVKEMGARKEKLEEYMDEIFEAVFIHRYRDSESIIRVECVSALGRWMKEHPNYWLVGQYLQYLGWVLTDENKDVRNAAIHALLDLYSKNTFLNSLTNFTTRFRSHLVQMAIYDSDLVVRLSCIKVLSHIYAHGLLDDKLADRIGVLVFEQEPKIRVAAGGFLQQVIQDTLESQLEEAGDEVDKKKLEVKIIVDLLATYGKQADGKEEADDEEEEPSHIKDASVLDGIGPDIKGRISILVDAIWDSVPIVRDWSALLEMALEDQTFTGTKAKKKKNAKELLVLSEDGENMVIDLLVASVDRSTREPAEKEKEKEKEKREEQTKKITQKMIEVFPSLFSKHQASASRITGILKLPQLIERNLYLDLRRENEYGTLWNDVQRQFTNHVDGQVIDQATSTIEALMSTQTLADVNEAKSTQLTESLLTYLRELVDGRDIEVADFDEDELVTISASLLRIKKWFGVVDIATALNAEDTGVMNMIEAFIGRASLGYKDEIAFVEHTLAIQSLRILWKFKGFINSERVDLGDVIELRILRDQFLEQLQNFALGEDVNTCEPIKRAAIIALLNIYLLSRTMTSPHHDPEGKISELKLPMDAKLQAKCAGFIEAEIENYASVWSVKEDIVEDEEGSGSETKTPKKKTPKKRGKERKEVEKTNNEPDAPTHKKLIAADNFNKTIGAFTRVITLNVISLEHAAFIISQYGRFDSIFDMFVKHLVQEVREEGLYGVDSKSIGKIITNTLELAFEQVINEPAEESRFISVCRLLITAVVLRGAHLAIVKQIPESIHAQIHIDFSALIVKRVSAYESDKEKIKRNSALAGFKGLGLLLIGISGREALKIRSAVEASIEAAQLEIPEKSQIWEPLLAYQRRLVTIMAKDPRIKKAATAQVAKRKQTERESSELDMPSTPVGIPDDEGRPNKRSASDSGSEDERTSKRSRRAGFDLTVFEDARSALKTSENAQSQVGEDEMEVDMPEKRESEALADNEDNATTVDEQNVLGSPEREASDDLEDRRTPTPEPSKAGDSDVGKENPGTPSSVKSVESLGDIKKKRKVRR